MEFVEYYWRASELAFKSSAFVITIFFPGVKQVKGISCSEYKGTTTSVPYQWYQLWKVPNKCHISTIWMVSVAQSTTRLSHQHHIKEHQLHKVWQDCHLSRTVVMGSTRRTTTSAPCQQAVTDRAVYSCTRAANNVCFLNNLAGLSNSFTNAARWCTQDFSSQRTKESEGKTNKKQKPTTTEGKWVERHIVLD
jgi:hypothetical protein